MKMLWGILLALVTGLVSAGEKSVTVAFIPKLTGNAFFESANAGAQAYAEKHGFTVKYMGQPTASVAAQKEVIAAAIADKVDAICLSSVDAYGLDGSMRQAMAAGIKAVTWDSDVSADARQIMVSQGTPETLGRMLVDMGSASLAARGLDPATDPIKYVWHYSQSTVADQNSWQIFGERYIQERYPQWINIAPTNYYSEQNAEMAVKVGESILKTHPDVDLIICNDSTALPGQCQAAKNLGKTKADVTITGFSSPNPIKEYCRDGILERWGLWDCGIQGAMGCYTAYLLATGKEIAVGDTIDYPGIGTVEVMPNTVLDSDADDTGGSGVVLLPEQTVFTVENMDNYDF